MRNVKFGKSLCFVFIISLSFVSCKPQEELETESSLEAEDAIMVAEARLPDPNYGDERDNNSSQEEDDSKWDGLPYFLMA